MGLSLNYTMKQGKGELCWRSSQLNLNMPIWSTRGILRYATCCMFHCSTVQISPWTKQAGKQNSDLRIDSSSKDALVFLLKDQDLGVVPQSASWAEMVGRSRSAAELRALWRKAIMEQILLIRMEKENTSLEGISLNDDVTQGYK